MNRLEIKKGAKSLYDLNSFHWVCCDCGKPVRANKYDFRPGRCSCKNK